jgi:hypothetical protein
MVLRTDCKEGWGPWLLLLIVMTMVFKVVHSKLLSETWEPRLLTHDGNNQPVLLAYAV